MAHLETRWVDGFQSGLDGLYSFETQWDRLDRFETGWTALKLAVQEPLDNLLIDSKTG